MASGAGEGAGACDWAFEAKTDFYRPGEYTAHLSERPTHGVDCVVRALEGTESDFYRANMLRAWVLLLRTTLTIGDALRLMKWFEADFYRAVALAAICPHLRATAAELRAITKCFDADFYRTATRAALKQVRAPAAQPDPGANVAAALSREQRDLEAAMRASLADAEAKQAPLPAAPLRAEGAGATGSPGPAQPPGDAPAVEALGAIGPLPAAAAAPAGVAECVACMARPRTHLFLPCAHLALCGECAGDAAVATCPICRAPRTQVVRVLVT